MSILNLSLADFINDGENADIKLGDELGPDGPGVEQVVLTGENVDTLKKVDFKQFNEFSDGVEVSLDLSTFVGDFNLNLQEARDVDTLKIEGAELVGPGNSGETIYQYTGSDGETYDLSVKAVDAEVITEVEAPAEPESVVTGETSFDVTDELNQFNVATINVNTATSGGVDELILTGDNTQTLASINLTNLDDLPADSQITVDLSTFDDSFEIDMSGEGSEDKLLLEGVERVEEGAFGDSYFFTGQSGEEHSVFVSRFNEASIGTKEPGEVIKAGTGIDSVVGGGGDDTVDAGAGNDTIDGGAGDDEIIAGMDEISLGGSGERAFDFPLIKLGQAADIDVNEYDGFSENAADLLGAYGDADTPLNTGIVYAVSNDLNQDDRLNDNDFGSEAETFTIMGETIALDSVQVYDASVTFVDGTSGNFSAVVIQLENGEFFLAPEPFEGADSQLLESGEIESISLNSVLIDNTNLFGLRLDANYKVGDNDVVDAGSGDDTVSGGIGDDSITAGVGDDSLLGGQGDDELFGGSGDDTIIGGSGDDYLKTGSGADALFGGEGDDTLQNASGDDSLVGGLGNDSIVANIGNDTLDGGDGADTLTAGSGDDCLVGGSGNDSAFGGSGDDSLDGGSGDDRLLGGSGNDTLSGGAGADFIDAEGGSDLVDYTKSDAGVAVDLGSGTGSGGHAAGDTLSGADDLAGSSFGDTLVGYDGTFDGRSVSNIIDGQSGDDVISGEGGADSLIGGAGDDQVSGDSGDDTIQGGAGSDTLIGGAGADVLSGASGDDTLTGGGGDDVITGGIGNDVITVGAGQDTAFGGQGDDTIGNASGDDSLVGGSGDDSITATDGADTLEGGQGSDTLTGGTGDDSLVGGSGDDVIIGSSGDDLIIGSSGDDVAFGGADQDTFTFTDGFGSDTIEGGEGGTDLDTLDFSNLTGPVTVTFTGDEEGTVTDGTDTVSFSEIERFILTSGDDVVIGDDTITRNDPAEIIAGQGNDTITLGNEEAADTLFGGSGDDSLDAGDGKDEIFGGAGSDTLVANFENNNGDLFDGGSGDDTYEIRGSDVDGFDFDIDLSAGSDNFGNQYVSIEEVIAGSGDDTIIGTAGNETLDGGGGADSIEAGRGRDEVTGGSGDDNLDGGSGDDTIFGGAGADTLIGNLGADSLTGGNGDDVIDGGDQGDTIFGGAGNDLIEAGEEQSFGDDDSIFGGSGDDTITSAETNIGSNDTIFGGLGNDSISVAGGGNELSGGAGADTIVEAGDGDDTIFGGSGDDLIQITNINGSDAIFGGEGGSDNDTLDLSSLTGPVTVTFTDEEDGAVTDGADTISFDGLERITLTDHADSVDASVTHDGVTGDQVGVDILAGDGNDTILGGRGGDTIDAGSGDDSVFADYGDDSVIGGQGDDTIDGGDGNDTIDAGSGDDSIDGGEEADTLLGGAGADTINGGSGDDSVDGGAGDDRIITSSGDDTLSGGDGDDVFVITSGSGSDRITDFDFGDDDADGFTNDQFNVAALTGGTGAAGTVKARDVVVSDDGSGNAVLTFPDGKVIVLEGLSPALLSASGALISTGIPCFTPETMIEAQGGARRVEDLKPGDQVLTRDRGYQPVLWAGRRRLSAVDLARRPDLAPVLIRKGVFGNLRPMTVSPQHAFPFDGRLVRARHLAEHLGGKVARWAQPEDGVEYIHLLLPRHELIKAEGAWTETFYPGPLALGALTAEARLHLLAAAPDLAPAMAHLGDRERARRIVGRVYGEPVLPYADKAAFRTGEINEDALLGVDRMDVD